MSDDALLDGPESFAGVLLLARDPLWAGAVTRAAAELGRPAVEHTRSPIDAIRRLVARHGVYSHMLIEPESAGEFFADLAGLTVGDPESGVALVVLGAAGGVPPGAAMIRSPARDPLRAALSSPPVSPAPAAPLTPLELGQALTEGMLQIRYQPIVCVREGTTLGFEALARLQHPVFGTLPPENFVPQLEFAGLAGSLTRAVEIVAMADLQGPHLPADVPVAINFPLDVLSRPNALSRLDDYAAAAGVSPARIAIELTESRPVEDLPALGRIVAALRARGFRLALDDLSPAVPYHEALLDLPFSAVKLDQELVRAAAGDKRSAAEFLLRTIARASASAMQVIAEGVESAATWRAVARFGVTGAQGFFIARPLPAAAIPAWRDHWRAPSIA